MCEVISGSIESDQRFVWVSRVACHVRVTMKRVMTKMSRAFTGCSALSKGKPILRGTKVRNGCSKTSTASKTLIHLTERGVAPIRARISTSSDVSASSQPSALWIPSHVLDTKMPAPARNT